MRASGCRGRTTPSPTSRGSATSPASARTIPQDIVNFFRPLAEAALDFIDKALDGRQWLVGDALHDRRHRLLGPHGVHGRGRHVARQRARTRAAWRDRLMAMPGFALPYDLIPKKDAEFG